MMRIQSYFLFICFVSLVFICPDAGYSERLQGFDETILSQDVNVEFTAKTAQEIEYPQMFIPTPKIISLQEPVRLEVSLAVFSAGPVIDASVTGEVIRPDGRISQIIFTDTGGVHARSNPFGDTAPGDGVYTAVFSDYSGYGLYTFRITAVSVPEKTAVGHTFSAGSGLQGATLQAQSEKIGPFCKEKSVRIEFQEKLN